MKKNKINWLFRLSIGNLRSINLFFFFVFINSIVTFSRSLESISLSDKSFEVGLQSCNNPIYWKDYNAGATPPYIRLAPKPKKTL